MALLAELVYNLVFDAKHANYGAAWQPRCQKLSKLAKILWQQSRTFVNNFSYLANSTQSTRIVMILALVYLLRSEQPEPSTLGNEVNFKNSVAQKTSCFFKGFAYFMNNT